MKKTLLLAALCLTGSAMVAQTWTALPVVTDDYTSYSTAKLQVNPITQRPSVGFKARANAAGEDFTKGMVYEYQDGQWKQIAVGQANISGSVFDYVINKSTTNSHGYMVYYVDDSTKVKKYGLQVERIYRGAPTYQVNPEDKTVRTWANDTTGIMGGFIQFPAALSYAGFSMFNDYKTPAGVITVVSNKTERSATYNYADNTWVTDTVAPVKAIQTYKSVQAMGSDSAVYVMSMLRGGNYDLTVSKYHRGEWSDLKFPNVAKNAAAYPVFDITVDNDQNVYTLSIDCVSGSNLVYVRKYEAATQTWSYLGGDQYAVPVSLEDTHLRIDMVAMNDGKVVLIYSDPKADYCIKSLTYYPDDKTWGEPEVISTIKASGTGDLTAAKTDLGELYVAYVNDDSKIQVLYHPVLTNEIFADLVCDTISLETMGLKTLPMSPYQITFANEALGVKYHAATNSYNICDKDTLGTTIFCDTVQAGFNLPRAGKVRANVNPGFVVTENPNYAIKAMRIYWYAIPSNYGRTAEIFVKDTPYSICSDIYVKDLTAPTDEEAAKFGTLLTSVEQTAAAYTDVVFDDPKHYWGINTSSTGLYVRSIVIGYTPSTGIESIEAIKKAAEGPAFNLQGQQVFGTEKAGIYVKGNRKVVVR